MLCKLSNKSETLMLISDFLLLVVENVCALALKNFFIRSRFFCFSLVWFLEMDAPQGPNLAVKDVSIFPS